MRRLLACCLVCLAAACFVCPDDAAAQAGGRTPAAIANETRPSDEATLLRALLDEVRQLRVVIQRTTAVTQRFQTTLERARSQQARVDVMTREIEGVRLQLSNAEFARKQSEERAKELDERLSQEQDARLHAALEAQSKEFRRTLKTQAAQEERQREREAQLAAQLQVEQLKLGEINSQLDSLQRELADLSEAKDQ